MAILPLAVVAVVYAVTAGQMQATESLRGARATALAEALLEEVLSKSFSEPGGGSTFGLEAGESTRAHYDDMDDYAGFTEAAGSLTDVSGMAYPAEYQRCTRMVTCTLESKSLTGIGSATPGLTITVTVSESGAPLVTLARFVANPS